MTKMAEISLNGYPIYDQNNRKTIPLGAAHTYIAHIREYPPPVKTTAILRICVRLLTSKYFLQSMRKQNASMLFCSMQIISQNVTQH